MSKNLNLIFVLVTITLFIDDGVDAVRRCRYVGEVDITPGKNLVVSKNVPTPSECCSQCISNPSCAGFVHTHSGDTCYQKSDNGPFTNVGKDAKAVAAVIEDVPQLLIDAENSRKTCSPTKAGQDIQTGFNLAIHKGVSNAECCEICKRTIGCKAFVRTKENTCYLKHGTGPVSNIAAVADGGVIGVAPSPAPCSPRAATASPCSAYARDSFDITPGTNLLATSTADVNECAGLCLGCAECHGFVFHKPPKSCYLKTSTDLIASSNHDLVSGIFL